MAVKNVSPNTKKLGAFSIWAIGVGMVISGESFGWNIGWALTGPLAFFIPVIITAVMYFALVQCLIELACVYPQADGPHTYIKNAFGEKWGEVIAILTLFEFLFVNPAIATSIGEYIGFLTGHLSYTNWIATLFMAIFCVVSLFNLSIGVIVTIALTILAILELTIYASSIVSEFSITHIVNNNRYDNYTFDSIIRAMPFAIWMFLAIEGISIVSKNIEENRLKHHITLGYNAAFWTLVLLAFGILFLAVGGIKLATDNWSIISNDNHPMPASLALILGNGSIIVKIFTFIGLFGLMASLQGVAFTTTFQLEYFLEKIKTKKKSNRVLASIIVFAISIFAIWGSHTALLIELSVLGAICMYFGVSLSLIRLRKMKQQSLETDDSIPQLTHDDFNSVGSRWYPLLTMILSLFCIGILTYLHIVLVTLLLFVVIIYVFYPKILRK